MSKLDKELEAIPKIEALIDGMTWQQKHRVLNFVRDRAEYDPTVDGGGALMGGLNQLSPQQTTTPEEKSND